MSEANIARRHKEGLTPSPGVLLVVTGASGAGKDTLVNAFLQNKPDFHRIVTYASRPMRPGEQDGVDYNFVAVDRFEEMIAGGELAEYFDYKADKRLHDPSVPPDYKGTARDDFERVLRGENVLWRIDPSRAANLEDFFTQNFEESAASTLMASTLSVYVGVPRLTVLLDRVRNRAGAEAFARQKESFIDRLRTDWDIWTDNQPEFPNVLMNDSTIEAAVNNLSMLVGQRLERRQSDFGGAQD